MTKPGFSSRTCPITAAFVKDMREVFGEDCRVIYLNENGITHGKDERSSTNQGDNHGVSLVSRERFSK